MQLLVFVVGILAGVAVGRLAFRRRLPAAVLAVAFIGGWVVWTFISYDQRFAPFGAAGELLFFTFGVSLSGELLYLAMKRVDRLEEENRRLSRDLEAERRRVQTGGRS